MEENDVLADLRRALAHLEDPPYLETLSIACWIAPRGTGISKGQALGRALRIALASLDPALGSGPHGGLAGRTYQVLQNYSLGKQSMLAIAADLGISERQAYRELLVGLKALAQVLNTMVAHEGGALERGNGETAGLRSELDRLAGGDPEDVDLAEIISRAVENVEPLAARRGIRIALALEGRDLRAALNRVMFRQAILNILSYAVAVDGGREITVREARCAQDAIIVVRHHPQGPIAIENATDPYRVATTLLDSLGISWAQREAGGGTVEFALTVPLIHEYAMLIVDDNADVIQLYRRYLQGQPCRVYGANSCDEALGLVGELRPDIILLDVMMPRRDGWELLQALRAREDACPPKIIVCSIIHDPQLAEALGADGFLHKPVSRADLVQSVQALLGSVV